jgi:acyl carrier protein
MAVDSIEVMTSLRQWIREHIAGSQAVPDDFPLIEHGLLTSLDTLELVLFLEQQFGIKIDDEDVTEENFRSVRAIAGLVSRKGL